MKRSVITIRNLPDEVHRALRLRAVHHGRSTEAEVRMILESIALPSKRVKLGSLLAFDARDAVRDGLPERFTLRRPWISRSIGVTPANPRTL